jgi:hypothetical protein
LRLGFEEAYTRRWSLVLSAGYFSKVAEYTLLRDYATREFVNSWFRKGLHPEYTYSPTSEHTIVLDIGLRFYLNRSPDGKKAVFIYGALVGYYYQRANFKFLILDTGMEEEHTGSREFTDYSFYRRLLFNFGIGAKFKLKDNLYLEPFFRSDAWFHMFTLYLGFSRRF